MRRIAFFLVSLYCLTACDNMVIDPDTRQGRIPDTMPQIQLFFPEEEKVSVYSTATEYENTILNLWVLSFNALTGVLDTLEFIDVAKIVKNGYATQLLPQLSFTPADGRRIVCIANSDHRTIPVNLTPLLSVTYSTINTVFTLNKENYYHGNDPAYLPMYGEFIWGMMGGYTCDMTRAVAKIQVQMGTSVPDVTGNFTAENVTYRVYNHGRNGFIQPTPNVRGIPYTLTSPVFYSTSVEYNLNYSLMQKDNAPDPSQDLHVYIFEYPSSNHKVNDTINTIDPKKFHPERQHIILAKDNSPEDSTFYRLDFYNAKDSTYFDTKRNHHYMFTINKVRSEGYRSRLEAYNNPGSNIEYEVRVNDVTNNSIDVISNGQYGIVLRLDSIIIGDPGDYNIGTVRYHLPDEMKKSPPHTFTTNSITLEVTSSLPPPTNLGAMTLFQPVSPARLDSIAQNIVVRVAPGPTTWARGFITFRLGNITHKWPITYYRPL